MDEQTNSRSRLQDSDLRLILRKMLTAQLAVARVKNQGTPGFFIQNFN